ncbi:hypothetical protein [Deinococcus misasensis]|jgi:hypothetical protein|uniref:hypothetical protein n=1 Tax=Deinococcus misasensis TaxID=392413 RepID=UPI000556113E|nr:hypothetical protein [Deinococcus misasensis]
MNNKNTMKTILIGGAAIIMVIGLLIVLSGDVVFGGFLILAGVFEIVTIPLILKKMEDMNR